MPQRTLDVAVNEKEIEKQALAFEKMERYIHKCPHVVQRKSIDLERRQLFAHAEVFHFSYSVIQATCSAERAGDETTRR